MTIDRLPTPIGAGFQREGAGPHLFRRLGPLLDRRQALHRPGPWPADGDPDVTLDFTSTDRLQLATEPIVIAAAAAALAEHGLRDGDQASRPSRELEQALASFLATEHVVLFPSATAASIGTFTALLRPHDHVVLDERAHHGLRASAMAAARSVHLHAHLDTVALRSRLARLRTHDTGNAILVVTESLFDTQSTVPDLRALQRTCQDFGAFLLVSVTNDLGCMGEDGAGALSAQAMLGRIDLVLGSFSQSFAAVGGFFATGSRAARDHVRHAVRARLGSIGLAPMQAAAAMSALRIIRAEEGRERRSILTRRADHLRFALAARGLETPGSTSPIVLVRGADDDASRIAGALAGARGLRTTLLEAPAVACRQARLRLQITTAHSHAQLSRAAGIVADAFAEAARPGRTEGGRHDDQDRPGAPGLHVPDDRLAFT